MARISIDPEPRFRFRRRQSRRRFIAYALLALLALAVISWWRGSLQAALWRTVPGLSSLYDTLARGGEAFAGFFTSRPALEAQNLSLEKQVAALQVQVADESELLRENALLKAMLGRSDIASTTVLAGVLMRPPQVPYDTLVIDAGAGQGINRGDVVLAAGASVTGVPATSGVYLGEIGSIYESSAQVVLFSSPGETHQGLLNGSVPVEVVGMGAGALQAQVPADTSVAVGDGVVFPGVAGGISEVVSAIDSPSGDSFKTLHLHLAASLWSLQFVFVRKASQ